MKSWELTSLLKERVNGQDAPVQVELDGEVRDHFLIVDVIADFKDSTEGQPGGATIVIKIRKAEPAAKPSGPWSAGLTYAKATDDVPIP